MTKKLSVPKEQFPEIDAYTGNIYLRYRLVSDDKNRVSAWTPIFEIDPMVEFVPGSLESAGTILGLKQSGYFSLSWDRVSLYNYSTGNNILIGELPTYDVWVQYGGNSMINAGPWTHQARLSSTSVNINVPTTYSYTNSSGATVNDTPRQVKIEIHRPVRPLVRYSPNRVVFLQDSRYVDIVEDTITFSTQHGLNTGEQVGYYLYNSSSAIVPLSDGATYWIRSIDDTKISLHPSQSDAQNNTNKINLTAAGQGGGVFVRYPFDQTVAINITTNNITMPYEHGFRTGDAVIYNAASVATPLVKETLYFVRVINSTMISLHYTRADAINQTNAINLTTTGSGYATLAHLPSLLYKTFVLNLN